MPRKSAASLAVVAPIPGQRPEPPAYLKPEEAELWRAVVATKPSDWFLPDIYPLLAAYCRAVHTWFRVSEVLSKMPSEYLENEPGVDYAKELTGIVERQAKLMADLATKMRLTPQSRYQPTTAAGKQQQVAPKWAFNAN